MRADEEAREREVTRVLKDKLVEEGGRGRGRDGNGEAECASCTA